MNTAQAVQEKPEAKSNKVYKIALTGLFAALSYVVFTFLQFKIYLPGGDATSIHLGNAVCVLGALLLGGFYGGLGGAIGMTIGDLCDPKYVFYAPKSFILKLCIGLITGLVAHHIGHINETKDSRKVLTFAIAAAVSGLLFNVIFDPLVGYYYKLWIMGKRTQGVDMRDKFKFNVMLVIPAFIASVVIYMPVRTALIRSGLFEKLK